MDRRSLLSGGGVLLTAQLLPQAAGARARTSPVTAEDAQFMQMAIEQAKDADYPFGAVIVRGGRVLAFGRNSTKRNSDPTAHAEMMAIRAFLNGHEPDALKETTLYSSGEPCVMCMGAIIWCGIKRLVFAASIAQLSSRIGQIDITAKQIANATAFSNIEIAGGFMSADAIRLFPSEKP
jgi:tRNA(adenine34) deaminase